MRKVILDTETTGLDTVNDRIIEVGCVELIDETPSGKTFHSYYNPGKIAISKEAENVHGLNNEFLKNFKLFDDIADELLTFLSDSQIIIHNAAFDLAMINNSLKRLNLEMIKEENALCTLVMARKLFPGSKVNLNALCKRFNISIEGREKHDAMTDCLLLAKVYIELIGGNQHVFSFDGLNRESKEILVEKDYSKIILPSLTNNKQEIDNHQKMLDLISDNIWEKN